MGLFDRLRGGEPKADPMGRFPAWYHAMEGRVGDLVRGLDQGVGVDHADQKGVTLLSIASFYGRTDAVRLLLERGADPNLVNNRGNGPLWEATRGASMNPSADGAGFDPEIVRMLLAAGADPSHANAAGTKPALWAQHSPELQAIYRAAGYQGEFNE